MNIFATIQGIYEFKEVHFYSLKLEREEDETLLPNEFEKFIKKFEDHEDKNIKEEYDDIIAIIEHLGEHSDDLKHMRPENAAFALPLQRKFKIRAIEVKVHSKLRLYCVLISDSVVILCNGGIKTKDQVQDCPNVRSHFRLANKLADYMAKNRSDFDIKYKYIGTGQNEGFYL